MLAFFALLCWHLKLQQIDKKSEVGQKSNYMSADKAVTKTMTLLPFFVLMVGL